MHMGVVTSFSGEVVITTWAQDLVAVVLQGAVGAPEGAIIPWQALWWLLKRTGAEAIECKERFREKKIYFFSTYCDKEKNFKFT